LGVLKVVPIADTRLYHGGTSKAGDRPLVVQYAGLNRLTSAVAIGMSMPVEVSYVAKISTNGLRSVVA
jgi:hypothetical protein